MRDVFFCNSTCMPGNRNVIDYLSNPESENKFEFSDFNTICGESRFLDLSGDIDQAIKWISTELSSNNKGCDLLNISTSSLCFSPEDYIDFWKKININVPLDYSSSRLYTGKGCNSFLSSIVDSVRLIENGVFNEIVNISIELHPLKKNRVTDYAFFGDGVSIIRVTNQPTNMKCDGLISKQCFDSESILPYKNFIEDEFYSAKNVHTLNILGTLYGIKYSSIPSFECQDFLVHSYGNDPIANFHNHKDKTGKHLIHSESPPGHIDSILVNVS